LANHHDKQFKLDAIHYQDHKDLGYVEVQKILVLVIVPLPNG
jgi:hypothetical protein